MGIRESLLNTITSVGSSDFVRIVTSAGASSKATLQNVIKSFETGLGAKTSLTTSDYIRVVGSDNNLYKQSMQSVSQTMMGAMTVLTSSDNLNNVTTPGIYLTYDSNIPANAPVADAYNATILVYNARVADIFQFYICNNKDTQYFRSKFGDTWRAWVEIPKKAAVDALINKKNYCINLGSIGSSDKTVSSADWTTILSVSNVQLNAGTYMFICPINAKWTQVSYQFYLGLQVDSTPASSLTNYAAAQDGNATAIGYINVPTTGNHTVSLIGRVTNAQKVVTLPAYQATGVSLIRMD